MQGLLGNRTINEHMAHPDEPWGVVAFDEPSNGNACHRYGVTWLMVNDDTGERCLSMRAIDFQHGPLEENGANGTTMEALLAICIDRLRGFQRGPYACHENARALVNCEMALEALKERTLARMARSVEGTAQA